jgi:hypothetical protein
MNQIQNSKAPHLSRLLRGKKKRGGVVIGNWYLEFIWDL